MQESPNSDLLGLDGVDLWYFKLEKTSEMSDHDQAFFHLRALLSNYYPKISPENWAFEVGSHGKPTLTSSQTWPSIKFNYSHSNDQLVIALTKNLEIGVDIEWRIRHCSPLIIAADHFSKKEYDFIQTSNEGQRDQIFFDLWTLKEAFAKAKGLGLSIPFNKFSFELKSRKRDEITVYFEDGLTEHPSHWQFTLHDNLPNYQIAVAVEKFTDKSVNIREFVQSTIFCRPGS